MQTRIMTAVVLLLLVVGVLYTGSEALWVTCLAVVLALAMDEWAQLCHVVPSEY